MSAPPSSPPWAAIVPWFPTSSKNKGMFVQLKGSEVPPAHQAAPGQVTPYGGRSRQGAVLHPQLGVGVTCTPRG